jgi:hypothetical protein
MADIQKTRISDFSFRQGVTLMDEGVADPLAPSVRPMGLDSVKSLLVDERTGSHADREWMSWVQEKAQDEDPDLQLPGRFAESFDLAREEIRQWLINDQGSKTEDTRVLKQCQRLLTEVRANLDLVQFYVNAVFKG